MAFTLEGNWKKGKAYDLHTTSSTYLGVDEFGHDRFENTRSEMGELVYQLKYQSDQTGLARIVTLLDEIGGIENFDFLIPIPPTKKDRPFQPVQLITEALGTKREVDVLSELVKNTGNEELKGISDPIERAEKLKEAIKLSKKVDLSGKKLLLVDDLYRSGATLFAVTELLYTKCKADAVCVLTMTKTRSNR